MKVDGCVEADLLLGFTEGRLLGPERSAVRKHLDSCSRCTAVAAALALESGSGASSGEVATRDQRPIRPGELLGRYRVQGLLGSGSFGVVFSAADPDLNRTVAIKLLHGAAPRGAASETDVLREARSLAQLTHPNVVAIYDHGTWRGRPFLVMEHVRGQTLRSYLATPRSWPELREVMLGAGRGLAAAHARGVVHLDFKPENVLVDDAGRAVVTDFGLGRWNPARADAVFQGAGPSSAVVVGTPAYMAPERQAGAPGDAAADQYAFAVTLYEALYGERPFVSGELATLREVVASGAPVRFPSSRRVPRRVRRVLSRALARDPASRYPSMDLLLEVLEGPRRTQLNTLSAAVVTLIVAGAVVFGAYSRAPRCVRGDARLERVWTEQRRAALRERFSATGVLYAASSVEAMVAALEGYAQRWLDDRYAACTATHERLEQSSPLLDLRMRCYDERLDELDATVEALLGVDARTLPEAARAPERLTPLEVCADPHVLRARFDRGLDAQAWAALAAARAGLVAARAQSAAGRYDRAHEQAMKLVATLPPVSPVRAEALLISGEALMASEQTSAALETLRQAELEGDRVGDDALRVRALLQLMRLAPNAGASDGGLWSSRVRSVVARLGSPRELMGQILGSEASLAMRQGAFDRARQLAAEAVAMLDQVKGPDSISAASVEVLWADALMQSDEPGEALERYRRAHRVYARLRGVDHPRVVTIRGQIAMALDGLGRHAEAAAELEGVIALQRGASGSRSPVVALLLHNLALIKGHLGDYHGQVALLREAIAIRMEREGPRAPLMGPSYTNLAAALGRAGRTSEALRVARQGLALELSALGERHPRSAAAKQNLAELLLGQQRPAEALDLFRSAQAVLAQTVGAAHPWTRAAEVGRGRALLALRRPREAIQILERQAAQLAEPRSREAAGTSAVCAYWLARAYDAAEGPTARTRAAFERATAALALAGTRGAGAMTAELRRDLEAWPARSKTRAAR